MKKLKWCFLSTLLSLLTLMSTVSCSDDKNQVDVLIIGGGASGISAGVHAARMGTSALIIEETTWLGGMLTSAGVSAIDGNYKMQSGIWGEFRDSLVAHYGSIEALNTGWVSKTLFEPSVGNKIFQEMAKNEENLDVWFETKLLNISKVGKEWHAEIEKAGKKETIVAKVLIDGTELGDVAKLCGVTYKIGMDSKHETGESEAPEEANDIIQDLTYVATLKDYGRDVTIPRPEGYDSTYFACASINDLCVNPKEPDRMWSSEKMITYGKLPNNKYMINWPLEGNDFYLNLVELTEEQRVEELKKAKNFTLQFVYFIQKELGMNTLGLADDEYPTEDLMPFIPYHRESRRIDGVVRFDLNHITSPFTQKEPLYRTAVAVGDYPVDHHHARYEGYKHLPNLYFHPVPSYSLPLGTLIPKDVDGLIVTEKSISVTNLVNGTTRLQPVVLQIGHVAGVVAALAVQNNIEVRDVSVRAIQKRLLETGTYLMPYLDVDKSDANFIAYQHIGVTGILKGEGRNVDWSNETWLRIDDPLLATEIDGLKDLYPTVELPAESTQMTYKVVSELIANIAASQNIDFDASTLFAGKDENAVINRGEFAVAIDKVLDPFNALDVDLKGNFKK